MPRIRYQTINFRAGALAIIEQANAICAEYANQGFDLTLRQLYYQFVARGFIPNRQTEYKRLGSIVNDARLAGLLDWDYIVDRTRNLRDSAHWNSPEEIIEAVASQFRNQKWDNQPTRVEAWIEKDALIGVLDSACKRRDVDIPFFSCRGYTSQSEVWGAAMRIRRYFQTHERVVILHLGDHDPSGIDMTRDITDRLRDFLSHHGIRAWDPDVFEVRRIALNMDQIDQYNPPPNPAKETDSRFAGYLAEYGEESWELDALDPPVLVELIRSNVTDLRDPALWAEAEVQENRERALLRLTADNWGEVEEYLTTTFGEPETEPGEDGEGDA